MSREWLTGNTKMENQQACGDTSEVFFNLAHTSGWHCENGLSLPLHDLTTPLTAQLR